MASNQFPHVVVRPPTTAQGVKPEVAQAIAGMLSQGRRYFGSAGASLTQHVNNPDYNSEFKHKLVTVGLDGERSTSMAIRRWMEDKPTAVLLDSVHIKGYGKEEIDEESGAVEGGDTDHVLIIGNHVFLIDTKRWKGRRSYSISDKGAVLRGGRHFGGGRVHAKQAKFMWQRYLDHSAKVSSIVCINSEKVFVKRDANWKKQSYRLTTIEQLTETLDYFYNKRLSEDDKTEINSTLVSQVAVCCIKPFDAYKKLFNADALETFR